MGTVGEFAGGDLPERDLPGFYRAAEALVSKSRWEGFGLAIAEALACGTPALLPAELGTARELLASGGGRTYDTADDLRAGLPSLPSTGVMSFRFCWDTAVAATLRAYRDVRAETEVASRLGASVGQLRARLYISVNALRIMGRGINRALVSTHAGIEALLARPRTVPAMAGTTTATYVPAN